ncbi:Hypothetical protein ORPV_270 [Orpheovirus IHUMI-LCC2]|uniref:Uncharacterized protein n=1 Tax=Orpheovirus IHUMI-LCC2 TaxID=2023057 RepID=A0A2I2L3R7_9VIRU|nr:Hypothetical protein ORPV_270 [Orpheovirus IHUMI-LCC2]SNW62174.1 Hypothetical protein ORPV_270 [Orpheovirus IHUMI-LCC2]
MEERRVEEEFGDYRVSILVSMSTWLDFGDDVTLDGYKYIMHEDSCSSGNRFKAFIPKPGEPHCGDCTKVSAPCIRCHMEREVDEANEKLELLSMHDGLTFTDLVAIRLCAAMEFNACMKKWEEEGFRPPLPDSNYNVFEDIVPLYLDGSYIISPEIKKLAKELIEYITSKL